MLVQIISVTELSKYNNNKKEIEHIKKLYKCMYHYLIVFFLFC